MNQEQIIAYLKEELPRHNREAFEKQLQTDIALKQQVESWKEILLAHEIHKEGGIKDQIGSVWDEMEEELFNDGEEEKTSTQKGFQLNTNQEDKKTKQLFSNPLYWAAAAIFVLLTSWGVWYVLQETNSLQEKALAYLDKKELAPNLSRAQDPSNLWKEAFREGKYLEAEKVLKDLAYNPNEALYAEQQLYLGLCNLYQNPPNAQGAILYLEDAPTLFLAYRSKTEWYLALAYLLQKENDKSREILEEISQNEVHPFYQQATELLVLQDNKHTTGHSRW